MPEHAPEPLNLQETPLSSRVITGLSKIGLALKTSAWQQMGPRGLTPTQAQVLSLLLSSPNGVRLNEIAAGLGVNKATASDTVSSLAVKGMLRKETAADDARAISVALTERGRAEAVRAGDWPDFLLETVEGLDEEEQAIFFKSLVKMIHSLQEKGRISVQRMCVSCRFFRPYVHKSGAKPHHCAFVDAAFGDAHVRLDCVDHQLAEEAKRQELFQAYHSSARVARR